MFKINFDEKIPDNLKNRQSWTKKNKNLTNRIKVIVFIFHTPNPGTKVNKRLTGRNSQGILIILSIIN